MVTKTQTPSSGDKHDYLSLVPYWWPDPAKPDGLPWIRKDGQVNPLTRGENVDQPAKDAMFKRAEALATAYYFSDDRKYAQRAVEVLRVCGVLLVTGQRITLSVLGLYLVAVWRKNRVR